MLKSLPNPTLQNKHVSEYVVVSLFCPGILKFFAFGWVYILSLFSNVGRNHLRCHTVFWSTNGFLDRKWQNCSFFKLFHFKVKIMSQKHMVHTVLAFMSSKGVFCFRFRSMCGLVNLNWRTSKSRVSMLKLVHLFSIRKVLVNPV